MSRLLLTLFLSLGMTAAAFANEDAASISHSLLKPFPNSEQVSYNAGFTPPGDPELYVDDYWLLVKPATHYGGINKNVGSTQTVSGLITKVTLRGPKSASVKPISRFYKKTLQKAGFELIFECSNDSCGGRNFKHAAVTEYNYVSIGESHNFYYLAVRRKNTYLSLYIALSDAGGGVDYGRVLTQATIVEPPGGSESPESDGKSLPSKLDRGIVVVKDKQGEEVAMYEESHALLVGVSDYSQWPKLAGVKTDIIAVHEALVAQGFKVETVSDPDQAALETAFEDFISRHGRKPGNRLLFYFAGHGYTYKPAYVKDDQSKWRGFIVSRDAPLPDKDFTGFRRNSLSMQRFEELAKDIEAKHAIFLLDSCFSGALIAATRDTPSDIKLRVASPVRQFITSGSADQAVPDVSIFRRQFIEGLEGAADLTGDGYVTGTELGVFLRSQVSNYSSGSQTPRFGKLRDPDLDKGDFVFVIDQGNEESK